MNSFRKMLFAMGLGLLVVALVSIPNRRAAATAPTPTPVPVTVTNTPLPVSGSVTGTVSGSVSVTNFPATQPVSLSNTSATPLFVDTDRSARNPASGSCGAGSTDGAGSLHCNNVVTVPIGKTLVIDYLSFQVGIPSSASVLGFSCQFLTQQVDGSQVTFVLTPPLVAMGTGGVVRFYQWSGPSTLYVASGGVVSCQASTTDANDSSGNASMVVNIAGHLVDP